MKNSTSALISAVLFCSLASGFAAEANVTQAAPAKELNACALLTSAEIQRVQGETVTQTKPNTPPSAGMTLSQCLFSTPTPSKSVSLLLASSTPDNKSGVRKFWRRQFGETRGQEHSSASGIPRTGRGESAEEELRDARSIEGIGDQAYWTSNGRTSALYVLRGDRFVRISVGGVRDETERLKRSTTLARIAVRRIQQRD